MTRVPRLALALLLLLLVPACGEGSDDDALGTEGEAGAAVLVDRWFVDAPTAEPGTLLVLGNEAAVFLGCGVLSGGWRAADGGSFVADVRGGSQACFTQTGAPALNWLHDARAFRAEGDDVVLLAEDGTTTARLRPGAEPTAGPDHSDEYAAQPTPDARMREYMADPAPLPAAAAAPTPAQLQRRWLPLEQRPRTEEEAFLAFDAHGGWHGSDGCNGSGGAYVLGEGGRLLATAGVQTLIGCDNWEGSGWPTLAARVGLVQGQLVLYDRDAREIGRVRAA